MIPVSYHMPASAEWYWHGGAAAGALYYLQRTEKGPRKCSTELYYDT